MVDPADGRESPPAHLNALALRLFGRLTLLGGVVLLLILAALLRLPPTPAGDPAGFLLPGTGGRHAVDLGIVPVLAASGGLLASLGLAALWFGRRPPLRGGPRLAWAGRRRPWLVLLGGVAVLAVVLLRR